MTNGIRPEAAIRASSTQDTFRYLDKFRPGLASEVGADMPSGHADKLMAMARTAWLPLDDDVAFAEAAFARLGADAARAFWTDFIVAHLAGSPLVSGATRTALRVLGSTPAALFKWYPKVVPTVYRDVFDVTLAKLTEHEAQVAYENVDARFVSRDVYVLVLECMAQAFLRTTQHAGHVRVESEPSQRRIRLVCRW